MFTQIINQIIYSHQCIVYNTITAPSSYLRINFFLLLCCKLFHLILNVHNNVSFFKIANGLIIIIHAS